MTTYKDFSLGVRIDEETAFASGGVEADAVSIGQVTNFSSTRTDAVQRMLGIGEGRNETHYSYGNVDISGTMDWNVLSQMNSTIGSLSLFKYAIGKSQGSGTTADPYEIVELDEIGYSASNIYTFAIWAQNEGGATDDVDLFEGCTIKSFSLNATQGDLLKASMDWVGKKVTSSTSISTAYSAPTDNIWTFTQGNLKWGATPSSISLVTSFSLTYSNNLMTYRAIGDRFIQQPEMGKRTYDFTITCKMTDTIATTLRDDLYGQANSFVAGSDPSELTANDELWLEFEEGDSSGDKRMRVELDQCALTTMSKPISVGSGLVEVTFTGFAKSGKADGGDTVFMRYWTET